MKVCDLQGAALDYWVARAQNWRQDILPVTQAAAWFDERGRFTDVVKDYRPSEDWAIGGPLIEKYCLTPQYRDYGGWRVDTLLTTSLGDTPLQAICRAVVRAAFGDEVEEVLP